MIIIAKNQFGEVLLFNPENGRGVIISSTLLKQNHPVQYSKLPYAKLQKDVAEGRWQKPGFSN